MQLSQLQNLTPKFQNQRTETENHHNYRTYHPKNGKRWERATIITTGPDLGIMPPSQR
jgi:hypothetical protein